MSNPFAFPKGRRVLCLALCLAFLWLPTVSLAGVSGNYFIDDDESFSSLFAKDGQLYALGISGIYLLDNGEATLITSEVNSGWEENGVYASAVLADEEGRLYAVDSSQRKVMQIFLSGGTFEGYEEIARVSGEGYPMSLFVQNGCLYWLESDGETNTLIEVQLSDGSERTLDVPSLELLASYRGSSALALTGNLNDGDLALGELDLNTGALSTLAPLTQTVHEIAYDVSRDCVYLTSNLGRLYAWTPDAGVTLAAYVLSGDLWGLTVVDDTHVAAIADGNVSVRDVTQDPDASSLRVFQTYGRSKQYERFLAENPEVAVVFEGGGGKSAEEQFVEDMQSRRSDIDVYVLSDPDLLSVLDQKGYFLDLSDSPLLSAAVEDMYAPFSSLIRGDNGIIALPQTLYLTVLGYRAEFFDTFQLEQPTDVGSLLSLAQRWLDEFAYENETARFDPFSNNVDLIHLLSRYADECAGNGCDVVYNTPQLQALLEQFLDVWHAYEGFGPTDRAEMWAMNLVDLPHSGYYVCTPLSILAQNEPVISGTDMEMSYLVINPFTTQPQAALRLVESVMESWDANTRLLLLRSWAHPVESESYAQDKALAQEELAQWEAELAGATEPLRKAEIEAEIQSVTQRLAELEEYRYDVTQEEVDGYLSVVNRIVLTSPNPARILAQEQPELFDQLMDGAMDVPRFLQTLDERAAAIFLEYQ